MGELGDFFERMRTAGALGVRVGSVVVTFAQKAGAPMPKAAFSHDDVQSWSS